MEDWQLRVIDERDELEARLTKLAKFVENENKFNAINECMPLARYSSNGNLLNRQYEIMLQYHQILTQRICLF